MVGAVAGAMALRCSEVPGAENRLPQADARAATVPRWAPSTDLPARAISAVDRDPATGDIWIGTLGDGIVRDSGGRFDRWDQLGSGLAGNLVFDLVVARGRVWAATNGGLSVFDPGSDEWRLLFARRADTPWAAATDLEVHDDEVIVALSPAGCFGFDGDDPDASPRELHAGGARCGMAGPAPTVVTPAVARGHAAAARPGIALFGPGNRTIALPGERAASARSREWPDRLAVELAVETASQRGGFRDGRPFELFTVVPDYAGYGWGLPEDDLVRFVYNEQVAGVLGWLRADDHVVAETIRRLEVPFVSVAAAGGDAGAAAAVSPWIFHCEGEEPRRHRRLIGYLVATLGRSRIAMVRDSHDGSAGPFTWWSDAAEDHGRLIVADVRIGAEGMDGVVRALREVQADAVLTWSDASTTVELIRAMRASSLDPVVVCRDDVVVPAFRELVGGDPGAVIAMLRDTSLPSSEPADEFAERYAARNVVTGREGRPGVTAWRSWRAADHLLAAIQEAGTDRGAVREALDRMATSGRGEIHWERRHAPAPVRIATLRDNGWSTETLIAP